MFQTKNKINELEFRINGLENDVDDVIAIRLKMLEGFCGATASNLQKLNTDLSANIVDLLDRVIAIENRLNFTEKTPEPECRKQQAYVLRTSACPNYVFGVCCKGDK